MAEIQHTETNDPDTGEFDEFNRVIQDIREMRERYDSRFVPYRRARSAEEADIASKESLPLFLSTPDDQDWQPIDQDAQSSSWPSSTWRSHTRQPWQEDARQRDTRQQDSRQQDTWQTGTREQDAQYQDTQYQDAAYQDTHYQDSWLHDVTDADRERLRKFGAPTLLKRTLKTSILGAMVVAAVVALFALQDPRILISNAGASLAAVLPGFSASSGRAAPAKEQLAAANPTPVETPAVAPTREAISVAYQTALQSQPEIRQPPALPPAPPAAPAARRLDPDELAALLKRAQGLIDLGDFASARLLLERAADGHEAKAAFILAQTYDPAVLGAADARSIAPDPEAARLWYQKAAQFGSQEAQQRLSQMQN
jgi:hypothetical protein